MCRETTLTCQLYKLGIYCTEKFLTLHIFKYAPNGFLLKRHFYGTDLLVPLILKTDNLQVSWGEISQENIQDQEEDEEEKESRRKRRKID